MKRFLQMLFIVCLLLLNSISFAESEAYDIHNLKLTDANAEVSLSAKNNCNLYVAFYNKDNKLIALKSYLVIGSDEIQNIPIEISKESECFYAKAFLFNSSNCQPLCTSKINLHKAWEYKGNAYYNDELQQYILVEDYATWTTGAIWFDKQIYGNFSIEFDYYTGSTDRNMGGGDGMVIAFYANKNYTMQPVLGFGGCDGYGIELDTWSNSNCNDPGYNHIALIKNDINLHIATAPLPESEDERWHHLKIAVKDNVLNAYVDGQLRITQEVAQTGNGYLGITTGTGDAVNLHAVKNIVIN